MLTTNNHPLMVKWGHILLLILSSIDGKTNLANFLSGCTIVKKGLFGLYVKYRKRE